MYIEDLCGVIGDVTSWCACVCEGYRSIQTDRVIAMHMMSVTSILDEFTDWKFPGPRISWNPHSPLYPPPTKHRISRIFSIYL
jgi:hypothetical protein